MPLRVAMSSGSTRGPSIFISRKTRLADPSARDFLASRGLVLTRHPFFEHRGGRPQPDHPRTRNGATRWRSDHPQATPPQLPAKDPNRCLNFLVIIFGAGVAGKAAKLIHVEELLLEFGVLVFATAQLVFDLGYR